MEDSSVSRREELLKTAFTKTLDTFLNKVTWSKFLECFLNGKQTKNAVILKKEGSEKVFEAAYEQWIGILRKSIMNEFITICKEHQIQQTFLDYEEVERTVNSFIDVEKNQKELERMKDEHQRISELLLESIKLQEEGLKKEYSKQQQITLEKEQSLKKLIVERDAKIEQIKTKQQRIDTVNKGSLSWDHSNPNQWSTKKRKRSDSDKK